MGWCHEFGCQITTGCNHPMEAGASACSCAVCDTVCAGKFSGCPEVFARAVAVAAPPARPNRPMTSASAPSGKNGPVTNGDHGRTEGQGLAAPGPATPAATALPSGGMLSR